MPGQLSAGDRMVTVFFDMLEALSYLVNKYLFQPNKSPRTQPKSEDLCAAEKWLVKIEGSTPLEEEMAMYQSMARPVRSSFDVMEFWKKSKNRLPLLSNLARKYLCIPATLVPTNRLFSASCNSATSMG